MVTSKLSYEYVLDIALHRNILTCIKCIKYDPDKVKQEELGIVRECGTVLSYEIEGTLNWVINAGDFVWDSRLKQDMRWVRKDVLFAQYS